MNRPNSSLGCAAMAGAIVFSVIYLWQILAAMIAGRPVNGRLIDAAISEAGLGGFLVFVVLFICLANDAHVARSEQKKRLQMLLERNPQSDEDFCRNVPAIDRVRTICLRKQLARMLGVPHEKIKSTDRLYEDLHAFEFLDALHKAALGGRTILEVGTDEVLEIVDKPNPTLQQVAEEVRLLTEWTARERDQQIAKRTNND